MTTRLQQQLPLPPQTSATHYKSKDFEHSEEKKSIVMSFPHKDQVEKE